MSAIARLLACALLALTLGALPACGGRGAHEPGGEGRPTAAPGAQLWTCGMHPQVIVDHPGRCPICGMELVPLVQAEEAAAPGSGGPSVTIDPVVVQNMGIRLASVTEGTLAVPVRAVGVLAEAEPAQRDVDLRVSGWVERLYAHTEGMHLAKGDPLFDLYSPELQAAAGELIAAERARRSATGADARASAAALAAAATTKLERLGVDDAEIRRLATLERPPRAITFRSPIRGHLVAKNVVEGAAVTAGTQAMRIVDHSRLWLDARVFEQDVPLVRIGQRATATLTALPGRTITGEVIFIHPHVDPETRTAMVRLEVDNPTLTLRPGMFASVEIATEAPEPTLLIPREAVIDTGRRQIAFVARDYGHFEPRTLTLGSEADGTVQVLGGLAAGESVVTSGQFLLDAESRTREAIEKYLARGLAHPPSGAPAGVPGHQH